MQAYSFPKNNDTDSSEENTKDHTPKIEVEEVDSIKEI